MRGDPAARLPARLLAADHWDLVARFESGHAVFATASVTNLGPAGRHAVVIGEVVEPDGSMHRFSRSEGAGSWSLSPDGRRIDLRSIAFDQSADPRRFSVDKDELELELEIAAGGPPAWPDEVVPGCPLDVLAADAAASGSYWRPGGPERTALRGRAAITHRWTPGLEVGCMRRGVELFVIEGELSIYFREVLAPDGRARPWVDVRRDGRPLHQGPPDASRLEFRPDAGGFPQLEALSFAAPGVSARVEFAAPLDAFEPLARLPLPLQWALGLRTRPRLTWSAPRFEVTLVQGGRRQTFAGAGLAKVAYTNPLGSEAEAALPAAPDLEPGPREPSVPLPSGRR
jgi:hypothetical protein